MAKRISTQVIYNRLHKGRVAASTLAVVTLFSLSPANAATLKVAVAANFKPTLEQLATQFQQQTGDQVAISSASSGVL